MNEFVRGCQKGEHELKSISRDDEPVTPQDPLQGRDGHFTPQTRRLKV